METNNNKDMTQLKAAKLAGISYLLILFIPILFMFIDLKITVDGDNMATINNIIANELLFRINTTVNLLMFIGVVVLAVALYKILKPVNKTLALLALLWRFAEAIIGMIAVLSSLVVLVLINSELSSDLFDIEQMKVLASVFLGIYWEATIIVFVLLALGSIICFYLFLKSGYIPKILSIWGIISYSLVLIGAIISLVFSGNIYMIMGSQAILFETVIGAWLLLKGIKVNS